MDQRGYRFYYTVFFSDGEVRGPAAMAGPYPYAVYEEVLTSIGTTNSAVIVVVVDPMLQKNFIYGQ